MERIPARAQGRCEAFGAQCRQPIGGRASTGRGSAGDARRALGLGMDLRWPHSVADLKRIQRERKRVAVERARESPFLKKRIPKGNAEDIWHRIPLLTKEEL